MLARIHLFNYTVNTYDKLLKMGKMHKKKMGETNCSGYGCAICQNEKRLKVKIGEWYGYGI